MELTIDRVQLAVSDRVAAAEGWVNILDAIHLRDDAVECLNARRSVYQVGRSEVEFLEPNGEGVIANSLKTVGRSHLFAGGVASSDLEGLISNVESQNIACIQEGGQAHVIYKEDGQNDIHFVLSQAADRESVGLLDYLYEATILVDEYQPLGDAVSRIFDSNADGYCPINSSKFKYDGYLTLFNPDELHRFEVIKPTSDETTMGRFHVRRGRAFYMAFAETPHMLEIEKRAKDANAGITVERPEGRAESEMADSMFLHPPALGGMMLGLSRPTQAWSWSGDPDRVVKI